MLRDSKKSNKRFVCSLSLSFYHLLSKFANSLDPDDGRRFAGPDLGQTSIPIVNLVSACPIYLRRLVHSYISKKRKFQTSTTNLHFLQDACSAPFHPCVNLLNLNKTVNGHNFIIFWYLDVHHSLLTVPYITLGSR